MCKNMGLSTSTFVCISVYPLTQFDFRLTGFTRRKEEHKRTHEEEDETCILYFFYKNKKNSAGQEGTGDRERESK